MENNDITFNSDDPGMAAHLYNNFLQLRAEVTMLKGTVSYLLAKLGYSEKFNDELFDSVTEENFNDLLISDPMLQPYWKDKIQSELKDLGITT